MDDHLASMFGSTKESALTAMDDTSYDFSFSNPSDSSSLSYLNSSETYQRFFYPNLSQRYFEDERDVKPFETSPLEYPLAEKLFDDQTPVDCNSNNSDSIYQDYNESYEIVLAEIRQVMKSVCDTHGLPLAQTWSLCAQQGRGGCQHKSAACISVISSASYVYDSIVLGFFEACSELHLLRGEGIAGKALVTNQPCFANDITSFSRTEYPLADHAKVLGLGGSVAIRLRTTYVGPFDFILEFFLPRDCRNDEDQKQMLSSISSVIQRVSTSLHVINDEELAEEDSFSVKETDSSWIFHMMEAQQRGENFVVSMGSHKEEPQEFKVINEWDNERSTFPGRGNPIKPDSRPKGRRRSSGSRKLDEKRRVKAERNISLPILQQYFPGSLKDAAKSIGVCPTTLKRICREHGIMRWPSRKIKKVGHSLKKLQLIIDSVQGAEGTIQLGSFYTNFPELSSPIPPTPKPTQNCDTSQKSSSCSSSCGSHSSGSSSLCCSKERKSLEKIQRDKRLDHHLSIDGLVPLVKRSSPLLQNEGVFTVKAVYSEQEIRLSMSQDWGLGDLQKEIMRRFSVDDLNSIKLKYLDDDSEWVLLTCDADLEECMDLNTASKSCTIKLFVHEIFHPEAGSSYTGNGSS